MSSPVGGPNFTTYLESWSSDKPSPMQVLQTMAANNEITPQTTINISFCSFDFSNAGNPLPGLQLAGNPNDNATALKNIVQFIHSHGGKVQLSFGGASYPLGPCLQDMQTGGSSVIAQHISDILKQYGLDGVDLDIEDNVTSLKDSTGQYKVVKFLNYLRSDLGPDKNISLTLRGQDNAGGGSISTWGPLCKSYVNTYNFMEYDMWVPQGTSTADQIKADIKAYIACGIPPEKIVIGLMPGLSNGGRMNTTIADCQAIVAFVKSMGLAGVMMWDANRDIAGNSVPDGTGCASNKFTQSLEALLFGNNNNDYNTKAKN